MKGANSKPAGGTGAVGTGYEPPAVRVLGSVQEITRLQVKKYGPTDGFTYQGNAITNASP